MGRRLLVYGLDLVSSAIQFDNLTLSWGKTPILKNINGSFEDGSLTAIVGPNGAGKSTLLKGIAQAIRPTSGRIVFASHLRKNLSILPQSSELDQDFPITTFDVVAMGAWRKLGFWRPYRRQDRHQILHVLQQVGLLEKADQLIGTLSGGQLQKALFARLIVREAQVMVLDEPFAAVDEPTRHELMKIILDWHAQGRTVIVVMHDMRMVREYFDQTLLLAHGVVAWGPTAEVLTADNLQTALERCAAGVG